MVNTCKKCGNPVVSKKNIIYTSDSIQNNTFCGDCIRKYRLANGEVKVTTDIPPADVKIYKEDKPEYEKALALLMRKKRIY